MSLTGRHILAIEITSRCASSCVKCYRRHIWGRGSRMDAPIFESVLDGLYCLEGDVALLLGTGEPILETDRVRRLIEWSNKFKSPIRLLTTGVPLVDRNLDILRAAEHLSVQVTFDGFCEKDLEEVQKINIELVKSRVKCASSHLKLVFNYTLTNKNYASLLDTVRFASECNAKVFYITPLLVYEPCEAKAGSLIPDLASDGVQQHLREASKLARDSNIRFVAPTVVSEPLADLSKLTDFCRRVGFLRPIVRVDGKVSVCWGREDVVLGDLRIDRLENLVRSNGLTLLRERQDSGNAAGFCKDCAVRINSNLKTLKVPVREPTRMVSDYLRQ